jgi:hypothetical protein
LEGENKTNHGWNKEQKSQRVEALKLLQGRDSLPWLLVEVEEQ